MAVFYNVAAIRSISAVPEGGQLRFDVQLTQPAPRRGQVRVVLTLGADRRFSPANRFDFVVPNALKLKQTIVDEAKAIVEAEYVMDVAPGQRHFTILLGTRVDRIREAPEHFQLSIGGRTVSGVIGAPPVDHSAFWWRQQAWFRDLLFDPRSEWRKQWIDNPQAPQAFFRENGVVKSYRDEVRQTLNGSGTGSYNEFGDARNYAKLARLLEVYLKGHVYQSNQKSLMPEGGRYHFGGTFVWNDKRTLIAENRGLSFADNRKEILITGDSITDEGSKIGVWTRALRQHVSNNHREWSIWNLAVSGSSTSSAPEGLSQKANLANALKINRTPGIVVITMTVNGLLRGDPLSQMSKDVNWMVNRALSTGAEVILIGGYRPFVYGDWKPSFSKADRAFLLARGLQLTASGYASGLSRMYDEVASQYGRNGRFNYIQNFWAPLDGLTTRAEDGRVQPLKGLGDRQNQLRHSLMDPVHPKADRMIAARLAHPINKVIDGAVKTVQRNHVAGSENDTLHTETLPVQYTASLAGLEPVWPDHSNDPMVRSGAGSSLMPVWSGGASLPSGLSEDEALWRSRLASLQPSRLPFWE